MYYQALPCNVRLPWGLKKISNFLACLLFLCCASFINRKLYCKTIMKGIHAALSNIWNWLQFEDKRIHSTFINYWSFLRRTSQSCLVSFVHSNKCFIESIWSEYSVCPTRMSNGYCNTLSFTKSHGLKNIDVTLAVKVNIIIIWRKIKIARIKKTWFDCKLWFIDSLQSKWFLFIIQ